MHPVDLPHPLGPPAPRADEKTLAVEHPSEGGRPRGHAGHEHEHLGRVREAEAGGNPVRPHVPRDVGDHDDEHAQAAEHVEARGLRVRAGGRREEKARAEARRAGSACVSSSGVRRRFLATLRTVLYTREASITGSRCCDGFSRHLRRKGACPFRANGSRYIAPVGPAHGAFRFHGDGDTDDDQPRRPPAPRQPYRAMTDEGRPRSRIQRRNVFKWAARSGPDRVSRATYTTHLPTLNLARRRHQRRRAVDGDRGDVPVNDPFVNGAWEESTVGADGKLEFVGRRHGDFAKAIGLTSSTARASGWACARSVIDESSRTGWVTALNNRRGNAQAPPRPT